MKYPNMQRNVMFSNPYSHVGVAGSVCINNLFAMNSMNSDLYTTLMFTIPTSHENGRNGQFTKTFYARNCI